MKDLVKNNLKKGFITTGLGVLLFFATIYSIFENPAITWGDTLPVLVLALLLVLMPDKLTGTLLSLLKRKAPVALLLLAFTGCRSAKENPVAPGAVLPIPYSKIISGDSSRLTISLNNLQPYQLFEQHNDRGSVRAFLDSLRNLQIDAVCDPVIIHDTIPLYLPAAATAPPPAPESMPEKSWYKEGREFSGKWLLIPGVCLIFIIYGLGKGLRYVYTASSRPFV
jgi:hypothetical protein